MIEGMLLSQIGSAGGSVTFYYDYGSFQEVSVNAAGNSADMAMPGVQFQFISKSGGNHFHGCALANYESIHPGTQHRRRPAGARCRERLRQSAASVLRSQRRHWRPAEAGSAVVVCRGARPAVAGALCRTSRSSRSKRGSTNITGKLTAQLSAERQVDCSTGRRARSCSPSGRTRPRSAAPVDREASACSTAPKPRQTRTTSGGSGRANTTACCRTTPSPKSAPAASATPGISGVYSDETRREDIGNLRGHRWKHEVARRRQPQPAARLGEPLQERLGRHAQLQGRL